MNRVEVGEYNFYTTLLGGQSLTWNLVDGEYIGFTTHRVARLKPEGAFLYWQTYPVKDDWEWLSRYLNLDADEAMIASIITRDPHVKAAYDKDPGIRILRQDFEDALVGFLCSANKSIVGIRQCIQLLADRFGQPIDVDGTPLNLFPTLERLALATEAELRECKVGFRAPNILAAAQTFRSHSSRSHLVGGDFETARQELLKLRGVGDKVADCILVYGLGFDHITPLDVWGKRFATSLYNLDSKLKYSEMSGWLTNHFEGYAAWAGQYLFEDIRGFKRLSHLDS